MIKIAVSSNRRESSVSLARGLNQHARERGSDVIGITSAAPIHCLPWETTEYRLSGK
jgi:hypothetical protein